MKKAHFEFEEIPFSTLARFGLTQEMIDKAIAIIKESVEELAK